MPFKFRIAAPSPVWIPVPILWALTPPSSWPRVPWAPSPDRRSSSSYACPFPSSLPHWRLPSPSCLRGLALWGCWLFASPCWAGLGIGSHPLDPFALCRASGDSFRRHQFHHEPPISEYLQREWPSWSSGFLGFPWIASPSFPWHAEPSCSSSTAPCPSVFNPQWMPCSSATCLIGSCASHPSIACHRLPPLPSSCGSTHAATAQTARICLNAPLDYLSSARGSFYSIRSNRTRSPSYQRSPSGFLFSSVGSLHWTSHLCYFASGPLGYSLSTATFSASTKETTALPCSLPRSFWLFNCRISLLASASSAIAIRSYLSCSTVNPFTKHYIKNFTYFRISKSPIAGYISSAARPDNIHSWNLPPC